MRYTRPGQWGRSPQPVSPAPGCYSRAHPPALPPRADRAVLPQELDRSGRATNGRHGVAWIIEIDILWLLCWGIGGKRAIPGRAIGMPTTVQVIGAVLRIRQRPIVFVAPLIQAHHKDLHRLVLRPPHLPSPCP